MCGVRPAPSGLHAWQKTGIAIQATVRGKQVVILNTPGGNVHEALLMATRIAKEGATTVVGGEGICASACFWMFTAGQHRIAGKGAKIGVHSTSDDNGKETDETLAGDVRLVRLSHLVGVPDHIIVKLITTAPSDIYWLNSADLAALHVEPFEALLAPSRPS
jgi:hypothetical protein